MGDIQTAINSTPEFSLVIVEQENYLATFGKYRQYLRDEFKKDTEVHEYQSPEGSGFILIEYKLENGLEMVKRTSVGLNSFIDHDWILLSKNP